MSEGMAKYRDERTKPWVIAREVSVRVKMKARVVVIGTAARMPPYFGST